LFAKTLTGTERAALLAHWHAAEKTGSVADLNARVVIAGVCDSQGARVFADADFEAVNAKSAQVLDRLATAVLALNGLTPGAAETAKKN
jgi:hypothetical protein